MKDIAIVTDTTSDIPVQLANKYKIKIVPLYVGFEGELYLEGKEITSDEVYKKLESGVKVHTSTPSVGDFVKVYRDLVENEKKTLIYSIHISSKLSSTSNSANQAKRFFPQAEIKVIDSKTAAISMGFIVLEVARAVERGESKERIDSIIDFMIRKNRLFATIENFEYIFRGGRTPFLKKFLSRSIKLKPILTIGGDGKVKLKKFVKNKRNSIVELYNQIRKDPFYTGKRKIGIFYGSDIEPAFELEKMIREDSKIKIDEIILSEVTTVMSAHTGPGIWGISSCPAVINNKDIFISELKDALKNLSEKSKDIFDDISEKSKDIFDNLSGRSKIVAKDLSERSIIMTKDLSDRSKRTLRDAIKDLSRKSKSASKDLSERSKKALKEALINLAEKIK